MTGLRGVWPYVAVREGKQVDPAGSYPESIRLSPAPARVTLPEIGDPRFRLNRASTSPPRSDGEAGAVSLSNRTGTLHYGLAEPAVCFFVWLLSCCANVAVGNFPPPLSRQRHGRIPFPFAGGPAYAVPVLRTRLD